MDGTIDAMAMRLPGLFGARAADMLYSADTGKGRQKGRFNGSSRA